MMERNLYSFNDQKQAFLKRFLASKTDNLKLLVSYEGNMGSKTPSDINYRKLVHSLCSLTLCKITNSTFDFDYNIHNYQVHIP